MQYTCLYPILITDIFPLELTTLMKGLLWGFFTYRKKIEKVDINWDSQVTAVNLRTETRQTTHSKAIHVPNINWFRSSCLPNPTHEEHPLFQQPFCPAWWHHKHNLLMTHLDPVPGEMHPIDSMPQYKQFFCSSSSVNLSINCSEYNVLDSPTPKQRRCHALDVPDVTGMQIQTKLFGFLPPTSIALTNWLQLDNLG